MATHQIGKLRFNTSEKGIAFHFGDGEIHKIPFGRNAKKDDTEEYIDDSEEYMDDSDEADGNYSGRYARNDDDYADDGRGNRGGYDDDDYVDNDGYADNDGYGDDDGYGDGDDDENTDNGDGNAASLFMRYVEENDWVTLLLLVLLPPLGIYLLWTRKTFDKIFRYALSILSAAWCFILILVLFSNTFGGSRDITQNVVTNVSVAPVTMRPTESPLETESAVNPILSLSTASATASASAAPTPLAGSAASATPIAVASASATASSDTVYSPASGLYYHNNRDCSRIPAGVSVSTVTVSVAQGRGQYRCPDCYGLEIFYATAGGENYHAVPNCKNMQNAVQYTREAAEGSGKTACTTCLLGTLVSLEPGVTLSAGSISTVIVSETIRNITSDKSGKTVYMTENGENYHRVSNCRGMQGAKAVSLLTALKSGKTACATCLAQANETVYCTTNGTWYHKTATSCGMKNAKGVELSVALVLGKTACPECMGGEQENTEPTPTPRTSGGPEVVNGVVYVYGTANGSYYHTYSVCGDMVNSTRVKLSYALSQGRAACPVCCKGADTVVYYMDGGTYYHCTSTCSNMPTASRATLAKAMANGYKRCPTCWAAQEKQQEAGENDKSGITVYVLENNKYYHTKSACGGMEGATKVKLAVAVSMGKTACPTCAYFANNTVYATKGGTYYHYSKEHAGNTATSGTLAKALIYGFKACPECSSGTTNTTTNTTTNNTTNTTTNNTTNNTTVTNTVNSAPTNSHQYADGTSKKYVYAAYTGKYYHLSKTCTAMENGAEYVTLEQALNYGKSPCMQCATYAAQTVFAETGQPYYHYDSTCGGVYGRSGGSLAKALAYGFKACPVCVSGTATAQTTQKVVTVATPKPTPTPENLHLYTEGTSRKYVYATYGGSVYHLSADCAGYNATYVPLERAMNYGMSACANCAAYASQIVYAKANGTYYHYDETCAGAGSSGGQLAKALAMGFKACPKCVEHTATTTTPEPTAAQWVVTTTAPSLDGSAADGNTAVYIDLDDGGMTYHRTQDCTAMSNPETVTLSFVLTWGYTPCANCKPPQSIQ